MKGRKGTWVGLVYIIDRKPVALVSPTYEGWFTKKRLVNYEAYIVVEDRSGIFPPTEQGRKDAMLWVEQNI